MGEKPCCLTGNGRVRLIWGNQSKGEPEILMATTIPSPTPHTPRLFGQGLTFSIRQLFVWTAFIALECVALRNAGDAWVAAMFSLALVILASALLLVLFRVGSQRAYWSGFAMCGWLYMLVLMYGWSLDSVKDNRAWYLPLGPNNLATSQLSMACYKQVYTWIARIPDTNSAAATTGSFGGGLGMGGFGGTPVATPRGPAQHDFVNVAHAFWTLLLATCGGWFARWLYLTGPGSKQQPQTADNTNDRR
jgi:hypothetical protein